ncbi:MAG TPA: hypothetical protein DCM07_31720 [Planctomycetaceae bacterium]|jgi:formylglycine-generating enzyme required for sulfatase activity|nr:hypothetical protein [Planctomycetaceae bacterium]|tara:strand:- start:246 stop:2018 length:1773 start_codon:yes stop_codon:yes gene_type:complete
MHAGKSWKRCGILLIHAAVIISNGVSSGQEKSLLVEPRASQKWAILIGVNDYINVKNLKFCGNDITALQKQFLAAGFRKDHLTLMHDSAAEKRYHPYKSNIESELDLLLGELDASGTKLKQRGLVEQGDMIVIAFSGHGIHPTGGKQSYFCPTDAVVDRPASMVSLEKLYKQLELCPANIKLLVVDACRNDPRLNGQKGMKATDETKDFANTLENPPAGILVLSSCAPGQVSWEDEQIQHGVFMKYLLQGMQGAADTEEGNRNQKVSLLELYKYAYNNTKTYVYRTKRKIQTPSLRGNITGDFEFGTLTFPRPDLLIAPFVKEEAQARQAAWARHLKTDVAITNSIGMKMTLIPPGEFMMGSSEDEGPFGVSPQHHVRLTKPYYLAETEVTQKQWLSIMGTTPWKNQTVRGKKAFKEGDNYAATNVSWNDTQIFLKKLSLKEGVTYRLPTEAEWEYACRAGTETKYYFGDNLNRSNEYAFFGPILHATADHAQIDLIHMVAQKKPNNFGLYDMHGGVEEWCVDWYNINYYKKLAGKTSTNPTGPISSTYKIRRGGSSFTGADSGASSSRFYWEPENRWLTLGFRVLQVID